MEYKLKAIIRVKRKNWVLFRDEIGYVNLIWFFKGVLGQVFRYEDISIFFVEYTCKSLVVTFEIFLQGRTAV